MPIFDSIRADGSQLCSFPLSSSNVSFARYDPLMRRTNLPRVSVSRCHSVRSKMLTAKVLKYFSIPQSTPYSASKTRTGSTADSDNSDSASYGRRTPSRTLTTTSTTKTSIPIRSNLTPGTSRPVSRQGSALSLISDDGTPSRIPTRRAGSTPSGSRTPTSRTPIPTSGIKTRTVTK